MKPAIAHKEIVLYSHDGEEDFTQLYQTYHNRLLNFASSILPDKTAAEDLVQELFTDLLDKRIRISQIVSLNAYLHRAISNRARNFLRNTDVYNKHVTENFHQNYHPFEFIEPDFNRQELYQRIGACLSGNAAQVQHCFRVKKILSSQY